MTNGFALNYDKSFQIYFFCVKRPAKKVFLKAVESTVTDVKPDPLINAKKIAFGNKTHTTD